ncbi:MAG: hypothetical protein ABI743_06685 [bacterium]
MAIDLVERAPVTLDSAFSHQMLRDKLGRLLEAATARGIAPLLTIAQSVHPAPRTAWHAATRGSHLLLANMECADAESAGAMLRLAGELGVPCYLDCAQKRPDSQTWRELLAACPGTGIYSDLSVWAEAILGVVVPHLAPSPLHEVVLVGSSPLTDAVAQRAIQLGYDVSRALSIVGAEPGSMALIGTAFHQPVIDAPSLLAIARDGVAPLCIDGGIGTFTPDALQVAQSQGWPVWRPDMRAALVAEIERMEQYRRLAQQLAGARVIADIRCVAGGVVGHAGDLVLDRIDHPGEILGWADGRGGLLSESTDPAWLAAREAVAQALGLN